MASENGEKSKVIMWLLGLLQTIIIGWCWCIGSAVVEAKMNIATLQANYANIMASLADIKAALK